MFDIDSEFIFLFLTGLGSFLIGVLFTSTPIRVVANPISITKRESYKKSIKEKDNSKKKDNDDLDIDIREEEDNSEDGHLDFNVIVPGKIRAIKTVDREPKHMKKETIVDLTAKYKKQNNKSD